MLRSPDSAVVPLVLLVARWVRVVAVTVAVPNLAIAPVLDDLYAIAAGRVAGGVHRIALAVVMRGVAIRAFAADGPPTQRSVFVRGSEI